MFSEDDAHRLKEAADVAKSGRLKAMAAARSFRKAADLLRSYELRHEIKSHLETFDVQAATQKWEQEGYVQSGARDAFRTLANAARQADLAALVAGFAAKLEILAQQLEWPVENLLSNRFAYRGDMMQVFSTVAQLISEAGWLSNYFYAMPSAPRTEHMKWLDTLDNTGVPSVKK